MNYLTSGDVQARLGISRETVEKLIRSGDLRAVKIGPHRNSPYRIAESDLQEYLDRQAVRPAAS
jgi:excisionase family DNA binding protein